MILLGWKRDFEFGPFGLPLLEINFGFGGKNCRSGLGIPRVTWNVLPAFLHSQPKRPILFAKNGRFGWPLKNFAGSVPAGWLNFLPAGPNVGPFSPQNLSLCPAKYFASGQNYFADFAKLPVILGALKK